jgi:hypothetical protein
MNPHLFAIFHFLLLLPSLLMVLVLRTRFHKSPLLKYSPSQLFLMIAGSTFAMLLSYELFYWGLELLFG